MFNELGGEGGFWQYTGSSIVLWLFNLFILALGLVKVFVYGDPILDSKSKASTHFWRHNKQAEFDLSKVSSSYMFWKLDLKPHLLIIKNILTFSCVLSC